MSGEKTRFVLGDRPPSVYDAAIPKKKSKKKSKYISKKLFATLLSEIFARRKLRAFTIILPNREI